MTEHYSDKLKSGETIEAFCNGTGTLWGYTFQEVIDDGRKGVIIVLIKADKNKARQKRHLRVRKHISGTAERPRLSVFRSLANIYVQIIDDENHKTLVAASSLDKDIKDKEVELLYNFGENVFGYSKKEIATIFAQHIQIGYVPSHELMYLR